MKNIINISSLRIIFATTALSLLMIGCGSEDPENDGNHIPDVNIVQNNKTVNVGTKVNLTAVAVDVDGDTLKHKWTFTSRPTGSSATLTTNTKKSTSFTADKAGKYVVKFSAKDTVDAEGKDTVTITAKDAGLISNTCTGYTEIAGKTYTTDTTLDGCFKVTRDININNNALLTIKPGSTLVFAEGVDLEVGEKGSLKAIGTAAQPIIFTAEQKTAGYWEGINFYYSNNVKNELAHVIVEYAGGGNGWYGNIHVNASESSPTRLKIRDSILRHGLKNGFHFDNGTILSEFKNVTSTKNALHAGNIAASNLNDIDFTSKFTGNTKNSLRVYGGTVKKDSVWNKLTVPVFVSSDLNINAFLTIKAGNTFIFDSAIDLEVGQTGALKAVGTAKEPILFTADQKTAGYWEGINFYYSNNVKNELTHVIVEYAGGGNGWYGNIHVNASESSPTRLKIRDSILRHGLKNGFHFDNGTILSEFKNVTSTKNALHAGNIAASNLNDIDDTSNFTGNTKNSLRVYGGTVKKDSVWNKLTVPAFVSSDLDINAFLTIKAGSTFIFANAIDLEVGQTGALKAVGTAKEPILFTADQKTAGYWEGINFYYSNNIKNELEYITVEYAGGGNGWNGNIHVNASKSSPTRLTIKNSTLSNGTKYGIWLDDGSIVNNDIKTANTFTNNTKGDIGSN